MPEIVKGKEGNVNIANKTCLRSDLAKEQGNIRTICGKQCRNINVRKSKAVIRI